MAIVVTGNTQFFNLTITPLTTVTLGSGQTFIVSGAFIANGTAQDEIILNATVPFSQAIFTVADTQSVAFVQATDMDSSGGNPINNLGGILVNSINWVIPAPITDERAVQFVVESAHQGPQILISWCYRNVSAIAEARLLRKKDDFPQNINDGVLVFTEDDPFLDCDDPPGFITICHIPPEDPDNPITLRINETKLKDHLGHGDSIGNCNVNSCCRFISDVDVEDGAFFYYRLFVRDTGSMAWELATGSPRAEGKALGFETGFFEKKMNLLLPNLYRNRDEDGDQKRLVPIVDQETGEQFFLTEDVNLDQGQEKRFLKEIGNRYDNVKALIDNYPLLFDVDSTCDEFLPLIAELVGVVFNFDIPIPQQREEIKRAVEVYKVKGTIPGTETTARNIVALVTTLEEFAPRVLVSNRARAKSSVFDIAIAILTGLPGDQNSYSFDVDLDGDFRFDRFALFFSLDLAGGVELRQATVEKLARKIPEFRPALTEQRSIFLDQGFVDETFGAVSEGSGSEVEDEFDEGYIFGQSDLISNVPGTSNVVTSLSARYVITKEEFFDVIT